jgi:hypothetical protein
MDCRRHPPIYPRNHRHMKRLFGIAALGAVLALPAATFAQTFAYVNASGEVTSMEAADAMTALRTAPGIHPRSGVMELDDMDDPILDESL